ncbi:altronate dehydratase family protein [Pirellulales bacterium]|nr:altronate dehydratase family protein [Pirellulales bacterium]
MSFLQIHAEDDLLVALADQPRGLVWEHAGAAIRLLDDIPAKQKVSLREIAEGEQVRMYGIIVGQATQQIRQGALLTPDNLTHAREALKDQTSAAEWQAPDVSRWQDRRFDGYVRDDGRVGTRNYWIVLPLVFCENRNLRMLREALVEELGYATGDSYRSYARRVIQLVGEGGSPDHWVETAEDFAAPNDATARVFPNVDGIKFLSHDGGCGAGDVDTQALCALLAGYVNHPNVAGATVLSLGCQKAQVALLEAELHRRNPKFKKPLVVLEQQQAGTEQTLMTGAIRHTLAGLVKANQIVRQPASLDFLSVGMECGGSDGFSGISANPAIGHCSDLIVALGGSVFLAEFPELAGCENELAGRCREPAVASRFLELMDAYQRQLQTTGDSFSDNPAPGNIRDGLITHAIKSAGAARKGGTSPVVDVLDYAEPLRKSGLNLLCTPGSDVESTTAMAGSGATAMLFSTGLGTPTGNAVAPVLKISSNSQLAVRMPDIIDCDAGPIITGNETIESIGERLLKHVIEMSSGKMQTKAELLGQDDFIPWKRGLSL